MKINDMDKYQLTALMKEVKEIFIHPETPLFDVQRSVLEEILNPPTDKVGYVQKFYLTDSAKIMVEALATIKKSM